MLALHVLGNYMNGYVFTQLSTSLVTARHELVITHFKNHGTRVDASYTILSKFTKMISWPFLFQSYICPRNSNLQHENEIDQNVAKLTQP